MTPYLAGIFVYPIKALDGVAVETARITASGGLEQDRCLAIFDAEDRFINGKRNIRVHALRATFAAGITRVLIRVEGTDRFSNHELDGDAQGLAAWLSEYFEQPVHVKENTVGGFPDDTDSPGPTLISAATLREVASWFPGLDEREMRGRLRPNLVVEGVPAFWEDSLYGDAGTLVQFQVGDVEVHGVNPCQRCVVPSRDPHTGDPIPGFHRALVAKREETLPTWANRSRFNHFYRLAVNTRIYASQVGKLLRVGDPVSGPATPHRTATQETFSKDRACGG